MKIKEIEMGKKATVEGIILAVDERETKTKDPYVVVSFSDGEQQIQVKKWNDSVSRFKFAIGSAVFITLKAEEYNGAASYTASEIVSSSADPGQFVLSAPVDAAAMYNFLYKTAGKCGVYAELVKKIMSDNKDKLLTWGAGKAVHHCLRGGLLYHTYRMTKTAAYIANVYNKDVSMLPGCRDINTELLIAGTILHDIGKLVELETSQFGESEYTVPGIMFGHMYIGAEMIDRCWRENKLNISEEDIMLLKHLILSHHGHYEWQAVTLPAIPEAMILHHVDCIDADMYQYEVNADSVNPGEMSQKVFGLDQRVYRPTWRIPSQPEPNN